MLASELGQASYERRKKLDVERTIVEDDFATFPDSGAREQADNVRLSRGGQGIQSVLAQAKEDWIIYLQSDGVEPEFACWVYPQKIVVESKDESSVRQLLKQ